MKPNKQRILIFIFLILAIPLFAQTSASFSIKSIIASVDTLRNRIPAEKLYLHFDKPYYSTGDTVWFKAYLFEASFLRSSDKSGLVYIELANDTNKVLMQKLLPLAYGIGWGNVVLNKDDIPEGSYTIRAYTNLMRNFGEDLVFKKSFYVSGSTGQSWLVNSNVNLFKQSAKDSIRLALQFNQLDKQILGFREMEIRVLEGKRKVLFRDKVQTRGDGSLDLNFSLPEKTDAGKISFIAEDLRKGQQHKVIIPVPVNRPENMDLQFMPEGGNLVAGMPCRIGFKAIGEDGLGTTVTGKIYNNANEVIAEFHSGFKGMGAFDLIPKAGELYKASIILPDGSTKNYPLPEVKSAGTTLRVRNSQQSDSLEVIVTMPSSATYYLIAQSRGVVCFAATMRGNYLKKVAKNLFPTGITKFTLLSGQQPVNERIVYIDHHDNLNIALIPSGTSYKARDSMALTIEVRDSEGKPVQGSFSVAVTDDNQVKTDTLNNNILTSLLLASDLKGIIEDPGHYFQANNSAWEDLDRLLLTQGWKGYPQDAVHNWTDIFNPPASPKYKAEKELSVNGKVLNIFNKSLAGTSIQLLSSRPVFFRDTVTNKDGSFSFTNFPKADTLTFLIQGKNKNGRSFNLGVAVDEFTPPVFKIDNQRFMPWYVNSDPLLLKYINAKIVKEEEELKLEAGNNVLKAVTITTQKVIKDSKNLNGAGNYDLLFDQDDMVKAKKLSLQEMLEKRFSSFIESRSALPGNRSSYTLLYGKLRLVIDGVFIDSVLGKYPEEYLHYLTSEDIKGIEIMSTTKNKNEYFLRDTHYNNNPHQPSEYTYLEITTWSGHGAYMNKTIGTYFYRSIPFAGRQQFYRPKYTAKSHSLLTDLRSTIHWEPNIITDKEGKALVSFYAAEKPGTYTIIMEGSDMNGNIGRKTGTITIK